MFLLSLLMLLYVFGVDSGSLAKRSFCVCVLCSQGTMADFCSLCGRWPPKKGLLRSSLMGLWRKPQQMHLWGWCQCHFKFWPRQEFVATRSVWQ